MAESIVGGLFGINPAMYQQQQQQQVFDHAVAMQNLNPLQQAGVGLQQAGYNFAGALGGAMGGVDPQLQRISALNAISKQIDQTNPESMMQGAKMLADAGFQQEALGLAEYARKANSELALAQQRMKEGRAAAIPKEVQIAEYSANLKTQLGQLQAMEQTPEVTNAISLLQNRLDALPQPKESTLNAKIAEAQRAGQITSQLSVLKGLPQDKQSPEAIQALETELAVLMPNKADAQNSQIAQGLRVGELTGQIGVLEELPEAQQNKPLIRKLKAELSFYTKGDKAEAQTSEVKNATAYANSLGFESGSKEWQKAYADKFAELIAKPSKEKAQSEFEQLLTDSGMTEEQKKAARAARVKKESTFAPPINVETKVNAYVPASETAQQDFIKSATEERKALRNAPDTLKNIDAAKKLIPSASTFMGAGGEPLLAAASFLNNRLGFAISTKGVTDATVLRTRLFEGILDNLKKLDSQPSQEQQRVLNEALGNLGTDPAALGQILDRIAETVTTRVERYNTDVTEAEGRGVKFPFKPQITMPVAKPKPADGSALIPTGKPAATNIDALLNKYK
jgi:hypothetical protein